MLLQCLDFPFSILFFFYRLLSYFKYCSSDSWSGNFETQHPSNTTNWNFLGSRIVPAIIQELQAHYHLTAAKEVVFTGSSAGAEGLYSHADNVEAMLHFATVK